MTSVLSPPFHLHTWIFETFFHKWGVLWLGKVPPHQRLKNNTLQMFREESQCHRRKPAERSKAKGTAAHPIFSSCRIGFMWCREHPWRGRTLWPDSVIYSMRQEVLLDRDKGKAVQIRDQNKTHPTKLSEAHLRSSRESCQLRSAL